MMMMMPTIGMGPYVLGIVRGAASILRLMMMMMSLILLTVDGLLLLLLLRRFLFDLWSDVGGGTGVDVGHVRQALDLEALSCLEKGRELAVLDVDLALVHEVD